MTLVKFCGMMRALDAALAGELGASYVGVIFAGGPRQIDAARAASVLDAAGPGVRRVGVFGTHPADEIAAVADRVRLDVVQLHADPTPELVRQVGSATGRLVWAAVRLAAGEVPPSFSALASVADGVVLDARVPGRLGGTGVTLPWRAVADSLAMPSGGARLVLAGGLDPENVATAVATLRPDIVDVSSGVELSPGIKDPARMRAFAESVRRADRVSRGRLPGAASQL